ncbi:MAG: YbjN domain-containing protein [Planctomycetota bacterium]
MGKIRQAVNRFAKATGWEWQDRNNGMARRTFITGDNGVWPLVLGWDKDDDYFTCRCFCPTHAPAEARLAVAEYLTRVNWMLCLCNFEMDFKDGEICLRIGLPLSKDSLSQAMIRDIVFSSNAIMDRYLPGLMKVVFGGATAEEAFRQVTTIHDGAGKDDAAAQQGNAGDPPMTRQQRVEQVAGLLRLMNKRTHEEAEGACFLILKARADRQPRVPGPDRTVQFCFESEWFSIDIPGTALAEGEDVRLLEATRRLYREVDSPDAGIGEPKDLAAYGPICRKYIYGDEQEAAEDACFVLYEFMRLNPDAELYVKAASFKGGHDWEQGEPLGKTRQDAA